MKYSDYPGVKFAADVAVKDLPDDRAGALRAVMELSFQAGRVYGIQETTAANELSQARVLH